MKKGHKGVIKIIDWLKLTEAKKISNWDDINAALLLHREIIQKKLFLKKLYIDFYNQFKSSMSDKRDKGLSVELGSGGVLKRLCLMWLPLILRISLEWIWFFSALKMPFKDSAVSAFL